MAGKYWREAASLILVGRIPRLSKNVGKLGTHKSSDNIGKPNYNIIFMKRTSKGSFADNFVFPGGTVDEADLNPNWISIFQKCGYTKNDLIRLLRFSSNLELYKKAEDILPELAFRICALRETFEETGLLLAAPPKSLEKSFANVLQLEDKEIVKWRLRVRNDPSEFRKLFEHINVLPSILSLHEWSCWLTPTVFEGFKNRFDTIFYTAFIDSEVPILTHDESEAAELRIQNPYEVLKSYVSKEIILAPPQAYEVSRFINFSQFDDFQTFSEIRSSKGISQWLPVRISAKDGAFAVLPGDDLYPKNPYLYSREDITNAQTIEELKSAVHMNRVILHNHHPFEIIIKNVDHKEGYLRPLTLSEALH